MGGGNGVNYKNNYHVHNLSQHDYSQLDQQEHGHWCKGSLSHQAQVCDSEAEWFDQACDQLDNKGREKMKLDKLAFNWSSQNIVIYVKTILKEGGIVFNTKKFPWLQNAIKVSIWSPLCLQKRDLSTNNQTY